MAGAGPGLNFSTGTLGIIRFRTECMGCRGVGLGGLGPFKVFSPSRTAENKRGSVWGLGSKVP